MKQNDAAKWVVVPVEPTVGMLVAGNHGQPGDFSAAKVWADMVEASGRSAELSYIRPRLESRASAAPACTVVQIEDVAARFASRTEFGEVIFGLGGWEAIVEQLTKGLPT